MLDNWAHLEKENVEERCEVGNTCIYVDPREEVFFMRRAQCFARVVLFSLRAAVSTKFRDSVICQNLWRKLPSFAFLC